MKTIKQWLNTLPKGLKESALKQADKQYLNSKEKCLSQAIWAFVSWHQTKEGGDFWYGFAKNLEWAEKQNYKK